MHGLSAHHLRLHSRIINATRRHTGTIMGRAKSIQLRSYENAKYTKYSDPENDVIIHRLDD